MHCKYSDNCTYYRNHKQNNAKDSRMLVECYCEGELHPKCRRVQYEAEFNKLAPAELAPNGYLVGTHQKQRVENTRRFKRYKVKDCICLLQTLDAARTFSAWMVDVSEGGMCLELNTSFQDLNIDSETNELKLLGYSAEDIPVRITKDVIKMVWQNKQTIGCSFVAPSHA